MSLQKLALRRTWEPLTDGLRFGSQSAARALEWRMFFSQSEKLHKVGTSTSTVCQNCGIKSASVSSDTALEIYGTDLVMGRSTSVVYFFLRQMSVM